MRLWCSRLRYKRRRKGDRTVAGPPLHRSQIARFSPAAAHPPRTLGPFRAVRIQLFVTCLVDLAYPEVGERTVALLERLGCEVAFPRGQTCCGQPAHNSGFPEAAARVTAAWREAFAGAAGPIVAPFGSCARFVG